MKYAFIDYENVHSLDNLGLDQYEKIFVFIGAKNTNLSLTEKFKDEINMTLITVKDTAKNNVDFHIAYYLGKLDITVDKNIEFYVLSKDQGYNGICRFIEQQRESRTCRREYNEPASEDANETTKETPRPTVPKIVDKDKDRVEQITQEYIAFMKKREKRHLPAKVETLKNNIHNQTSLKGSDKAKVSDLLAKVINKLTQEKILKITESKVIYP